MQLLKKHVFSQNRLYRFLLHFILHITNLNIESKIKFQNNWQKTNLDRRHSKTLISGRISLRHKPKQV